MSVSASVAHLHCRLCARVLLVLLCVGTGACNLWRVGSSTPPAIVAQLTGVDCEPIHDVCFSTHFAYLASHNTVRSYAVNGIATNHQDTTSFHSLQLPQRTSTSEGQPASAAVAAK